MLLKRWIEIVIHRRGLVLVLAAGMALIGFISLTKLPFDAFPDTTPVQVQVITVAMPSAPSFTTGRCCPAPTARMPQWNLTLGKPPTSSVTFFQVTSFQAVSRLKPFIISVTMLAVAMLAAHP